MVPRGRNVHHTKPEEIVAHNEQHSVELTFLPVCPEGGSKEKTEGSYSHIGLSSWEHDCDEQI